MIEAVLQQANDDFFSPRAMQLDLLKNHQEAIPTLAKWVHDEWHPFDKNLTLDKLLLSFQERLNTDKIPITFVVLKEGKAVATFSLKKNTGEEFADIPPESLWLGSLHVVEGERRQGIAQELLKVMSAAAKHFGSETVYFFTSNPKNIPWYVKNGALVLGTRPFRGHEVTLLSQTQ